MIVASDTVTAARWPSLLESSTRGGAGGSVCAALDGDSSAL
jgi:hypothetical protein